LKVVALVQARMGSKRLPGKSLLPVTGKALIRHVLDRASQIVGVDDVCLVTSLNPFDTPLAQEWPQQVYRGSEWDVLDRMDAASRWMNADVVMRITGDCPLLASDISTLVLKTFRESEFDYVSNVGRQTRWPDGFDTEVFSARVLHEAHQRSITRHDREHVTTWIRSNYEMHDVMSEHDYGYLKLSVDRAEDLERVRRVCGFLDPNDYSAHAVLAAVRRCGLLEGATR
jgi:spore coat polysaccharide biosynthesis protein SpsF (cytidylyltransferase family)